MGLGNCGTGQPPNPGDNSPVASPQGDPLRVVVTANVLCEVTAALLGVKPSFASPPAEPSSAIGAGLGSQPMDLHCLLDPFQDPHTYQPTPSDRRALADADLILYGGYGLEASFIQLLQATTTATPPVPVYELAVPNPLPATEDNHSHGHGDSDPVAPAEDDHGHGDEDPHIWHRADYGAAIVATVAQQLIPLTSGDVAGRSTALQQQLLDLHQWIQAQTNTIPSPQRYLITTHDAFRYFGQAYGVQTLGILDGLNPSQKPSAATLADLAETVRRAGVPMVFPEVTSNGELLRTVAQTAGVQVAPQPLWVEGVIASESPTDPPMATPGAFSYSAMLVANTCEIVTGLGGQCDRSTLPPSVLDPKLP